MINCKNCGTEFRGKFCPQCGQAAEVGRLTKKYLVKDLLRLFGSTEKGKFFLMKELFRDPGAAARGYIKGERKKYYNPVQFYLYTTATILFVTYKLDLTSILLAGGSNEEIELNRRFIAFIFNYINAVEFIILPLFTFFTFLFFRVSGYNYSELFVLNTYSSAQRQVVSIVLMLIIFFVPDLLGFMSSISVILNFSFLVWFYISFFDKMKKGSVIYRTVILILIYYALIYVILYAVFLIFIMLD
ncbi:MAG: DUF3667 domain-containing protein [Ignavibacteria bacterium]|nr:DUF3667 domain-containing protein [Ignavibacteria bacterium]